MDFHSLINVNDYEWEIPRAYRDDMRVPVRIFATRELLLESLDDLSLDQAVNAATLPGLVGPVVVMPDIHQGYGFPIGGVAATRYPEGVISPGGIGYDINCGVRLMASTIELEAVRDKLDRLAIVLDHYCPSGVGGKGEFKLTLSELDQVCQQGARWALHKGYALKEDLDRTEESGSMSDADPSKVGKRAKERGMPQLGTLGSGNHFIEVDVVDQIFAPTEAQVLGLFIGCLVVQIHCGSRGFGHQVCSDYVQSFQNAVQRYGIHLPDRELVCAPLDTKEGQDYLAAMRSAANYAFTNRQLLANAARRAFEKVFAGEFSGWQLRQVYDIAHNIGKVENHLVNGKMIKVCVHRKGATRAFGPGSADLPTEYQAIGQPVLVPGSMGTSSWVLVGTQESMKRSWGSSCHGAGRLLSRAQAKKRYKGEDIRYKLGAKGIHIRAGSMSGLAEEAPQAYKDVDQVIETVVGAGIAAKVARLRPIVVIKG